MLEPLGEDVVVCVAGVMLLVGLLLVYYGKKMLKFVLFLSGFAIGSIGVAILIESVDGKASKITILVISAICGLLGGSLCVCALTMGKGALVIGLALSIVITLVNTGIISAIGSNTVLWVVLGLVICAFLLLAYKVWVLVLVLATSSGGALICCASVLFLVRAPVHILQSIENPSNIICDSPACAFATVGWFLLTITGIFVQLKLLKKSKEERHFEIAAKEASELGVSEDSQLYKKRKELELRKAKALKKLASKIGDNANLKNSKKSKYEKLRLDMV